MSSLAQLTPDDRSGQMGDDDDDNSMPQLQLHAGQSQAAASKHEDTGGTTATLASPPHAATTVPVSDRVYLLGPWFEPIQGPLVPQVRGPQVPESRHPDKVSIKEVVYVDLESGLSSGSGSHNGAISQQRPFWVPANVPSGNWSLDPACFWTVSSVPLTDLESGKAHLQYNPMSDYSLELIRWYRPDLFDKLFLWFSQLNDHLYSQRQLHQINGLIRPERVVIDDFEANFSDNSPAAVTLKTAVWGDDVLPEIEHYMTLLHLRAYSRQEALSLDK